MDAANITLVLVIVTALAFDFTNGFHDTANAMAASISTGALKPKVAVGLSAILNLVGAFLSVQVALTVTNAVINNNTVYLSKTNDDNSAAFIAHDGGSGGKEPKNVAVTPGCERMPAPISDTLPMRSS